MTTCELYLQFVQRHAQSTYRNRRSYRDQCVNVESGPRTVPPDEYPAAAEAVAASPIRSRVNGNGGGETGMEMVAAIQQLSVSVQQLLHN